jgi:hypothetical protein
VPRVVEGLVEIYRVDAEIRLWVQLASTQDLANLEAVKDAVLRHWRRWNMTHAEFAEWCARYIANVNAVQVKNPFTGFSIIIYPEWP